MIFEKMIFWACVPPLHLLLLAERCSWSSRNRTHVHTFACWLILSSHLFLVLFFGLAGSFSGCVCERERVCVCVEPLWMKHLPIILFQRVVTFFQSCRADEQTQHHVANKVFLCVFPSMSMQLICRVQLWCSLKKLWTMLLWAIVSIEVI